MHAELVNHFFSANTLKNVLNKVTYRHCPFIWLKYCRYGVKHYPINQSILCIYAKYWVVSTMLNIRVIHILVLDRNCKVGSRKREWPFNAEQHSNGNYRDVVKILVALHTFSLVPHFNIQTAIFLHRQRPRWKCLNIFFILWILTGW